MLVWRIRKDGTQELRYQKIEKKTDITAGSVLQHTEGFGVHKVWRHLVSAVLYSTNLSFHLRLTGDCFRMRTPDVPQFGYHSDTEKERNSERGHRLTFCIYSPAMHRYMIYDLQCVF